VSFTFSLLAFEPDGSRIVRSPGRGHKDLESAQRAIDQKIAATFRGVGKRGPASWLAFCEIEINPVREIGIGFLSRLETSIDPRDFEVLGHPAFKFSMWVSHGEGAGRKSSAPQPWNAKPENLLRQLSRQA
jgi:hypothetical protein